MRAGNVGNSLAGTLASSYISGFTLEKSLTCAANVGKPTVEVPILFGIRRFTLEKSLMNAIVLMVL